MPKILKTLSAIILFCICTTVYAVQLGGAGHDNNTGVYAYLAAPDTTTCTDAGTYYRVEGTFSNEIIEDFSIVSDKVTYDGVKDNVEIIVNGSFLTDTVNTEVSMALFKNGVIETNSIMTVEIDKSTDISQISLVDVWPIVNGDNIEIRIACDKAGAVITTNTMNTSLKPFFKD